MSPRALSALSWALGLAGVALAGYAGYDWYDATRDPPIAVEVTDLVVDGAVAGQPRVVEYVVTNGGGDALRLVGAESC